jgi:hypothetical protein
VERPRSADELSQRGALGVRARQAVDEGLVQMVTGFRTEAVEQTDAGVVLVAEDGRRRPRLIVNDRQAKR